MTHYRFPFRTSPTGRSILERVLIKAGVDGLRDLPHRCPLLGGLRPLHPQVRTFMAMPPFVCF